MLMDDQLMLFISFSVEIYLKDVKPSAEHGIIVLEVLHQGNLIDHSQAPGLCSHEPPPSS